MVAEEFDRKCRLKLQGIFNRCSRFAFLPGYRQSPGEMRKGQEAGRVKLTGLPAIFDCFIVAADSVQRYALHHKRQPG